MNRLVAISGCSAGGKSTLLTELNMNGYTVVPDVGREIVKEQSKIKTNNRLYYAKYEQIASNVT